MLPFLMSDVSRKELQELTSPPVPHLGHPPSLSFCGTTEFHMLSSLKLRYTHTGIATCLYIVPSEVPVTDFQFSHKCDSD